MKRTRKADSTVAKEMRALERLRDRCRNAGKERMADELFAIEQALAWSSGRSSDRPSSQASRRTLLDGP